MSILRSATLLAAFLVSTPALAAGHFRCDAPDDLDDLVLCIAVCIAPGWGTPALASDHYQCEANDIAECDDGATVQCFSDTDPATRTHAHAGDWAQTPHCGSPFVRGVSGARADANRRRTRC